MEESCRLLLVNDLCLARPSAATKASRGGKGKTDHLITEHKFRGRKL